MKKKLITGILLLFVGISLTVAMSDVAGWRRGKVAQGDATGGKEQGAAVIDASTKSRYLAIYFHAPHRCPTCLKIEAYAHEALSSEIDQGILAWKVADYTAEENEAIVDKCKVMTSTVVLVDQHDGKIVRCENLEGVWDHTGDQNAFTEFIKEKWKQFREASGS